MTNRYEDNRDEFGAEDNSLILLRMLRNRIERLPDGSWISKDGRPLDIPESELEILEFLYLEAVEDRKSVV